MTMKWKRSKLRGLKSQVFTFRGTLDDGPVRMMGVGDRRPVVIEVLGIIDEEQARAAAAAVGARDLELVTE